jgi:hypothetical protein
MKMVIVYKGKILNDNEMNLPSDKRPGGRDPRVLAKRGAGFNTGFGGGLGALVAYQQKAPNL